MIIPRVEPLDVQSTERNQLANMQTNKSGNQEAAARKLQEAVLKSNTKSKNEISGGKTATNQKGKRKQLLEGFGGVYRKEKTRGGKVRMMGMLERSGKGCRWPKPKQGTSG
ncbi:hypothetical protein D8674_026725 [Pyrus ussuriensis x Pyrus communis]|uniref:Uncharacterized protein n=1 Tax=Pyrus ussuriensis x Pyrus communis TaxID=2448454 RepID=A0A5N5IC67_9ROSA|nr:hypothetical protein D8674_026725 [Pyrus ussuriensis x Pyrus communis]